MDSMHTPAKNLADVFVDVGAGLRGTNTEYLPWVITIE